MDKPLLKLVVQTIGLGFLTGMRSMAAPALLALALKDKYTKKPVFPASVFHLKQVVPLTTTMAAAEIVSDKLPFLKARIEPPSLAARVASGALTGLVLHQLNQRSLWRGAIIGGMSALAGAYSGYYARKKFVESTQISDPVAGLAEDAFVVSTGLILMNEIRKEIKKTIEKRY